MNFINDIKSNSLNLIQNNNNNYNDLYSYKRVSNFLNLYIYKLFSFMDSQRPHLKEQYSRIFFDFPKITQVRGHFSIDYGVLVTVQRKTLLLLFSK